MPQSGAAIWIWPVERSQDLQGVEEYRYWIGTRKPEWSDFGHQYLLILKLTDMSEILSEWNIPLISNDDWCLTMVWASSSLFPRGMYLSQPNAHFVPVYQLKICCNVFHQLLIDKWCEWGINRMGGESFLLADFSKYFPGHHQYSTDHRSFKSLLYTANWWCHWWTLWWTGGFLCQYTLILKSKMTSLDRMHSKYSVILDGKSDCLQISLGFGFITRVYKIGLI